MQFQTRLLDDESDKTPQQNTQEIQKNGHTPLGASNVTKKTSPLGIGILTNLRVLVLCVLDPSSSPLLITNQHIHSKCDENENENENDNDNNNDINNDNNNGIDDDCVRVNKGNILKSIVLTLFT